MTPIVDGTVPHFVLAPLVRGLCINAVNMPRTVVSGTAVPGEDGAKTQVPGTALAINISSAFVKNSDGQLFFNEESAAKTLSEAYAAWEFEMFPSGAEAARFTGSVKKQPSCIALTGENGLLGLYWIDRDLDSALKRRKENDSSFIEEIVPPAQDTDITPRGLSSRNRGDVVKNRIAVVTGGAQGFGEQIVLGLASSGALVFIADLNLEGAEKLAARINTAGGRTAAIAVALDVTGEESSEALYKTIAETAGGLDLCVSNAGVLKAGSVMEQELASFKFTTEVNYVGYFITVKHAGRLLKLQHLTSPAWKTDIVQINSKSGLEGSNKNGAYAGSKFGGIGLTASFALELIEYNVKVNSICPGNFFDGPLWSDPEKGLFVQYLGAGKVAGAKTIADVKAYYEGKVPMKRGCEGPDVMKAIYYLVEQEYETGQAVPVTGGQVMLH
ncbi:MAG: SDR family NAD(P)-dependent oxidoreductase [Treponema sp.]|jgi:sorbitol-6-phosphate 2-dehydrogenase|nr:SDR family NAD(P)-dependent oxidoreductase [Treponema sp.]